MPKITVVIPVYKAEKYIEQCVRSVFEGNVTDIEVIALSDGSPDNSFDLLKKLQAEFPNLIALEHKNMGGSKTLNKGLALSKGQYVMFLDGDDWLPPKAIDTLYARINQDQSDIAAGLIKAICPNQEHFVHDTQHIVENEVVSLEDNKKILNDGMYLGKLIKKDLLVSHQIQFNANLLYADRPFLVALFVHAQKISLLYTPTCFWRQRNDVVNQSITDRKFHLDTLIDRIKSIYEIRDYLKISGKQDLIPYIDNLNAYRILWHLNPYGSYSHLVGFSKVVKKYLCSVNVNALWSPSKYKKDLMRCLNDRSSRLFPFYYWGLRSLRVKKKINSMLAKKKATGLYSVNEVFYKELLDQDLVFFDSYLGKSFSGNPKYIYQELKKRKRFKAVWTYNLLKNKNLPSDVIQVKRNSPDYFSYLERAKYWVTNVRLNIKNKPEETIYLQTWHGTPIKKLGADIAVAGPERKALSSFLNESKDWDYLLAANKYSEDIFKKCFKHLNSFITGGYPSNDIFHLKNVEERMLEIKKKIGAPLDKKILIYAPTWRDDRPKGNWVFDFNLKLDLEEFVRKTKDEYFILLRFHHLVSKNMYLSKLGDSILNVSDYEDVNELLLVSDLLITDYSSIFFDYANLKRPMIFYMYDQKKYRNKLRGFYFDPEKELPGPIVSDQDSLLNAIKNVPTQAQEYQGRYDAFYDKFCRTEDGNWSQRVVDEVFSGLEDVQ